MNKLVLATATMVVVGAAVAGGLVWSGPVRVAVQRAVSPGPLSPRHGPIIARSDGRCSLSCLIASATSRVLPMPAVPTTVTTCGFD